MNAYVSSYGNYFRYTVIKQKCSFASLMVFSSQTTKEFQYLPMDSNLQLIFSYGLNMAATLYFRLHILMLPLLHANLTQQSNTPVWTFPADRTHRWCHWTGPGTSSAVGGPWWGRGYLSTVHVVVPAWPHKLQTSPITCKLYLQVMVRCVCETWMPLLRAKAIYQ